MADSTSPADSPLARIRALLDEYGRKQRTLPALLADLKHEVSELEGGNPVRDRVLSGLRALGRAWSETGDGIHSTLTIDGERRLHEALEDLKRALDSD